MYVLWRRKVVWMLNGNLCTQMLTSTAGTQFISAQNVFCILLFARTVILGHVAGNSPIREQRRVSNSFTKLNRNREQTAGHFECDIPPTSLNYLVINCWNRKLKCGTIKRAAGQSFGPLLLFVGTIQFWGFFIKLGAVFLILVTISNCS